jgi:hypothetical protein
LATNSPSDQNGSDGEGRRPAKKKAKVTEPAFNNTAHLIDSQGNHAVLTYPFLQAPQQGILPGSLGVVSTGYLPPIGGTFGIIQPPQHPVAASALEIMLAKSNNRSSRTRSDPPADPPASGESLPAPSSRNTAACPVIAVQSQRSRGADPPAAGEPVGFAYNNNESYAGHLANRLKNGTPGSNISQRSSNPQTEETANTKEEPQQEEAKEEGASAEVEENGEVEEKREELGLAPEAAVGSDVNHDSDEAPTKTEVV